MNPDHFKINPNLIPIEGASNEFHWQRERERERVDNLVTNNE